MDRKAFLDQEAPPGYVAGVGRGATGFTTSADTGPVVFHSEFGSEVQDGADEAGILAQSKNQSLEDEEADRIYDEIDQRMQSRRRKRAQDAIADTDSSVEIHTGSGTIQQRFSDLKGELALVSSDEWANLPEVGDMTRKNKRQRLLDQQSQRTYAAPDTLIASSGFSTSERSLSNGEDSLKVEDIEKWEQSASMVGDLEKGRLILASLRRTEPYNADSWISSARLEEQDKQFDAAKSFINQGCNKVPYSAEIWMEAIRLHRSDGTKKCKSLMNEALRLNPESEELWHAAVDLENQADVISRRKVLMKALEFLPRSVSLWKALVDLESDDADKIRLLTRATELCSEWGFWLLLVNLSAYSEAKAVLNKARKQLPAQPKVWVTALKLEERQDPAVAVEKLSSMFAKGIKELEKNAYVGSIDEWLENSISAEEEGFSKTAQALVNSAFSSSSEDNSAILRYAEDILGKNVVVATYIYLFVTEKAPHDVSSWMKLFASLKKAKSNKLYEFYDKAIGANPESELFYMVYAKDKWIMDSDVAGARSLLEKADKMCQSSERLWFARLKLEVRSRNFENAYQIAKDAKQALSTETPKVWYKLFHITRYMRLNNLIELNKNSFVADFDSALELFPENWKLHLQKAQVLVDFEDIPAAIDSLSTGIRMRSHAELFIALANLEAKSSVGKARSSLDRAVLALPEEPSLWETKINLEIEQKDMVSARQLISRALKQFPHSPAIWMLHLKLIPKASHRKNAFLDALKSTNNSTEILLGIGLFFWIETKFQKAKSWFDRALASDANNGDAWAWLYCFQRKLGNSEDVKKVETQVAESFDSINKGAVWNKVAKDPANLGISPENCIKLVAQKLLETTKYL